MRNSACNGLIFLLVYFRLEISSGGWAKPLNHDMDALTTYVAGMHIYPYNEITEEAYESTQLHLFSYKFAIQ